MSAPEGNEFLQLVQVEIDDVVVAFENDGFGILRHVRVVVLISAGIKHCVLREVRLRSDDKATFGAFRKLGEPPVSIRAEARPI